MDRAPRSELLKTIESQNEKVQKYEAKLRDLVRAYKGLTAEKEALEATVNALSVSPSGKSGKEEKEKVKGEEKHGEKKKRAGNKVATIADPLNASGQEEVEDEVDAAEEANDDEMMKLKDQLSTLTSSLSTVMQEKSKIVASYQAEKKNMKQEHEEVVSKLKNDKWGIEKELKELKEQLHQVKTRIRSQQHEREKEQNDHAIMLRELQKLLANERMAKEQLEHQIDEMKQKLTEKKAVVPDNSAQNERKITDLKEQLETARKQLKAAEQKVSQPSPMVLKLQKEVSDMKTQHRLALQHEQGKAQDTEDRLKRLSGQSEERISSLEAKLSELSEVVGNYEKLRYQDQTNMQKMKDRITQLDTENSALSKVAHNGAESGDLAYDESSLDVQALVDKIIKLKGLLKKANEKSDRPVNVKEIFEGSVIEELDVHGKCDKEYQALKEEFERYKLRAQSLLKSKSHKETNSSEVDLLKTQVTELKDRLRVLRIQQEEQEVFQKQREENSRKTIHAIQQKHKEEMSSVEAEHNQRLGELEIEIRKHRDRTISLMSEKDREIEVLRRRSPERYEAEYVSTLHRMSSQTSDSDANEAGAASSEETTAVNQLLQRTSLLGGTPGESSLLHFAQEQARRDVEINSLRKQKHSLESALRDLQFLSSAKEEKYSDQVDFLKEEIRKLERNKSRESANLEYLKNVVYHYMISSETSGKLQMLKAISTILEFSPHERKKVEGILGSGWWGVKAAGAKTTKL